MRHCITLYLKGYKKYDRSKLKAQLLLRKFRLLNLKPLFFNHLKYRVMQYLIGKLSDMLKMGREGFVVAALLASMRMS